ncbi:MAG: RNA polymerase sigma factor RpoS [Nitrospira sp.]|nr:RNA polymerase sigma factor RpoS [Nitrospira sp.]
MFSVVPVWGARGCPLLPESLRLLWAEEPLPPWLANDLGLPTQAKVLSLNSDAWQTFPGDALPDQVQSYLVTLVRSRMTEISGVQVFVRHWPPSLASDELPWSVRTRNRLREAGILGDNNRLSQVTFGDLFSLRAMGTMSVLDFACVAEGAFFSSRTAGPDTLTDHGQTLLEAIEQEWAAQISSQDPRFAELLPVSNRTIFENVEHFTAEPEDPPIDEMQLARSLPLVETRLKLLSVSSLDAALSDFVGKVSGASGDRLKALVRRLGCDGQAPATLEDSATLLSVTRERMRQIQKRFSDRLPTHAVYMPQLDAAIRILLAAAPIGLEEGARLLRDAGVSSVPFHPKSILAAAEFCHRPQPFEIDSSLSKPRVVVERLFELEKASISVAYRQANASGATNIQEVGAELAARGIKVGEAQLRGVLAVAPGIEFLEADWFWDKSGIPDRNRLRNITRKMLSVASPISVAELREGVQRNYRIRRIRGLSSWPLATPPRAVLQAFYQAHPEFTVTSSGMVSSIERLDYRTELSPTEAVLHSVLRSSPATLLDRYSFGQSCLSQGMNPYTFSQHLSMSPIITHIGTDMWSLRGLRIDPAAIEALKDANAAKPHEKRVLDHGWTADGSLWIAARLPERTSHFVLGIPGPIRRLVIGKDFAATDEHNVASGTVRVNDEGTSYGYSPFLSRKGADENDLLLVSFDLSASRCTLRVIDDEELEQISPS